MEAPAGGCTLVDDSVSDPPPVTPEPIERMFGAGRRHNAEWAL